VAVVGYSAFGRTRFPPRSPGGPVLSEIAKQRGCSPRQVALAFLTRRPSLFAIPKSAAAEHVRENAVALDLDASEIQKLETGFPLSKDRGGVPML
jgi:diketogulonate reductase-like aldo/keto reductase